MRISILTFNIHNNLPSNSELTELSQQIETDNIIINFQEMYFPIKTPKKFLNKITQIFKHHKIIYSDRMFGLYTVFLTNHDDSVGFLKVGLGFLFFPNKGFIAFRYKDIVFVNAHLAPHKHNNLKRIEMVDYIFKCILYKFKGDFNSIVFTGDLNFRLENKNNKVSIDENTQENFIEQKDQQSEENSVIKNNATSYYNKLRKYDQINAFFAKYPLFEEPPINFKPTYKYLVGLQKYDKKREPAYCDRILVYSNNKYTIVKYDAISSITISDHKPVFLLMDIETNNSIGECRLSVHNERTVWHSIILTKIYCVLYKFIVEICGVLVFTILYFLVYNYLYKNK